MARSATVSALLIAALLGCGSDAPDPLTPRITPPSPESAVGVTVTSWGGSDYTDYVYTWTGGDARRLTVTRISEPEEVIWEILAKGSGIQSPVVHGNVPDEATAANEVEPTLTPGTGARYRVSVELTDEQTGSTEFVT